MPRRKDLQVSGLGLVEPWFVTVGTLALCMRGRNASTPPACRNRANPQAASSKGRQRGGADLYFASDIVWISTPAQPTGPVASS
jgi:hypothetical protein